MSERDVVSVVVGALLLDTRPELGTYQPPLRDETEIHFFSTSSDFVTKGRHDAAGVGELLPRP